MKVWFDSFTLEYGRDDFDLIGSWDGEVTRVRRPPERRYRLDMRVADHADEELAALHRREVDMYELIDAEAFDRVKELAERALTAEATITEMGGTGPLNATSPVRMARFFYLAMRETAGTPVRKMMDAIEQALLTNPSDLGALEALTTTLRAQRASEAAEAARIIGTTTSNAASMPSMRDLENVRYSFPIIPRVQDLMARNIQREITQTLERITLAESLERGVPTDSAAIHAPAPAPPPEPASAPREGTRFDLLEVDVEPRVVSAADGETKDALTAPAPGLEEARERG